VDRRQAAALGWYEYGELELASRFVREPFFASAHHINVTLLA
jgi:hypothetical protein